MLEISRSAYNALGEELDLVEQDLRQEFENLESAREKGDLSENSEYDQSKMEVERLQKRRNEIMTIMQTCKIVNVVSSNKIQPGTLIEVTMRGIDDPSYRRDLGLLMFDNVGNSVIHGKITPSAPLGNIIKDGGSGTYEFIGAGGKRFYADVSIVPQDRLGEFLEKYPTDFSSRLKAEFTQAARKE